MRGPADTAITWFIVAGISLRMLVQNMTVLPRWFQLDDEWIFEEIPSSARVLKDKQPASSPYPPINAQASHILDEEDAHIFMSSNCYVVEDICFSSSPNRTKMHSFYKAGSRTTGDRTQLPRQPKIVLGQWSVDAPTTDNETSTTCQTSPIPNHIVLYGNHLHMIMEFYLRVVAGLYQIVLKLPWWSQEPQSSDIQLYLRVPKISSSHHVFLAPFTRHPLKLFQDLLEKPPAATVNIKDGGGPSSSCTCLPRLVFCGHTHKDIKGVSVQHRKDRMPISEPTGNLYNLIPKGHVARPMGLKPPYPQFWQDLRNYMRQTMVDDPRVLEEITGLKHSSIGGISAAKQTMMEARNARLQYETGTKMTINGTTIEKPPSFSLPPSLSSLPPLQLLQDWKLIGFSQRLGRRRWLNLPHILQQCNDRWNNTQYKVTCIEVNTDVRKSRLDPLYQVALHGGLSAMIGIHGSQQAHAVWLPPHAHQLELLPHLQGTLFGSWTQDTHIPTMNGWMVHETDINHMGYPLDYQSVPNCSTSRGRHKKRNCNDSLRWDDRDFVVEWSIIERYITSFLLPPPSSTPQTCDDFESKADDKFVMYNIHCPLMINLTDIVNSTIVGDTMGGKDDGVEWVYRHFYRSRSSFSNLQRQKNHFPNHTLYALPEIDPPMSAKKE